MNFLAHLHLADRSDDLLVGSFLGDFCKGSIDRFPSRWRPGLRLHRRIDAFTDRHELAKRSATRIRGSAGRYSPVVVDVLYDHFLAAGWDAFSHESLQDASRRYYTLLAQNRETFPDVAAWVAKRMDAQDWLGSYREIDGVRMALARMSSRLRDGFRLDSSIDLIEARYYDLRSDFMPFYGEIATRAADWMREFED